MLSTSYAARTAGRATLLGAALLAFTSLPSLTSAQGGQAPTQANAQASAPGERPFTPAEYSYGFDLYVQDVLTPVSNTRSLVRPDAVNEAVMKQTDDWVKQLQTRPTKGIQLDPMGELYVAIGQDDIARKQFAERLSTPGLSLPDKAYTLLLATKVFAQPLNPERIRTALDYMAQLDAMPVDAITWKYNAHDALANAYYVSGNGPEVIKHASKALAMIPSIPFERRKKALTGGLFTVYADAISGQPGGRASIDSMAKYFLPLATPAADLVAKDSAYYWMGRQWARQVKGEIQLTSHLGKAAPPIIATNWYNASAPTTPSPLAPGATSKALNDGRIRLMEYGEYSCVPCRMALPGMDRIRKANPQGVDVIYVTKTEGAWGATLFPPQEEAKHLEHYYVARRGLGIQIALWAGPKETTDDGGILPADHPTWKAYPIQGTPTFVITDGKGIVRHIAVGYSGAVERMLQANVQFLLAEQKRAASAAQPGESTTALTRTASRD